ncbi:sodium-translocating pyrophosphatase [Candidatus Micrarchaeota archaeon]|nr:sodium-translocating pyrophosphatase [Candidatus Micrarchaeota archaeon]
MVAEAIAIPEALVLGFLKPLDTVFVISLIALGVAGYLAWFVLKQDSGSAKMQEIAGAIKEGAEAFIKRQYTTIAFLAIALALLISGVYWYVGQPKIAVDTGVSFLFGAFCSALAGVVGMHIAVRTNLKSAAAVIKSPGKALEIALRGGAVSGLIIVAMSLLGVALTYYALGANPQETPFLIVGFGFGASFVALFAQLGGGIYTKGADVGADLVGKVEAGIPEDDERNPAVIADLVGDNVGDCAGRGADLFESTAAENIGAMILGVALFPQFGVNGILFPLVARAFGLIASIIGIFSVKAGDKEDPMKALNRGYYVTSIIAAVLFLGAANLMLNSPQYPEAWKYFGLAGLVGIALSIAFVYITQYYTEAKYRPVQEIAKASVTGPATNIITGFSVALECTALPIIAISIALLVTFHLGQLSGIPNGGFYGTAIATMGMLATCAYILAMDTFGPIVDNAGGIVEMSKVPKEFRVKAEKLDAAGNTTKALTKGYAIGSAALAAFLLFTAYMDEVTKITGKAFEVVDIAKVEVFVGAMLGAMLVFLFSALAIRAVSETAQYVIQEVRRQFKDKRILEGTLKPDYARCVDITTVGALKNMVLPGIVAVAFPVIVGFLLKYEAMAAFLMVGTISGILLATVLNNGGGAWDNAKKHIETGAHGGKGSETHKSGVVGDTVGDPFKDTAGPSLHVLIKLMATLTLVLAPLFI